MFNNINIKKISKKEVPMKRNSKTCTNVKKRKCRHCGKLFNIIIGRNSNSKIVKCPYCNNPNKIESLVSSKYFSKS